MKSIIVKVIAVAALVVSLAAVSPTPQPTAVNWSSGPQTTNVNWSS